MQELLLASLPLFAPSSRLCLRGYIIAVNMGTQGQLSRILNETFTSVMHPLLPLKAAPGQLSFKQIQEALHLVGELPSKQFYLFCKPIAHSMSPTLHNSGFQGLGLPHSYRLLETQSFNEKNKEAITADDVGGASVTIPYKLDVIPFLDELTPAAKVIGAVNTIIPRSSSEGKRMPVGDNMDWLGVRASVVAQLAAGSVKNALVIGGGGTARACCQNHQQNIRNCRPIHIVTRGLRTSSQIGRLILQCFQARYAQFF